MGASVSSTNFASVGGIMSGSLVGQYCPDPTTVTTGISIGMSAEKDPMHSSGLSSVLIQLPDLGFDHTYSSSSFLSSQSGMVAFNGFALYQTGSAWLVKWTSIEIWANGTLQTTLGASSLTSSRLCPTGVPFIGAGVSVAGAAVPNPAMTAGVPTGSTTVGTANTSGGCTVTGGFRFRETPTGAWQTLPVNLSPVSIPSVSCDASASGSTVSVGNTNNASVQSNYYQGTTTTYDGRYTCYCNPSDHSIGTPSITDVYQTVAESDHQNGSVTLLPNLTKGLGRIRADDFAELVYRGGFPLVQGAAGASCQDVTMDPPSPTVNTVTFHPQLAQKWAKVTGTAHVIEQPLGFATYAPYVVGGYAFKGRQTNIVTIQPGACPIGYPSHPSPCWTGYSQGYLDTVSGIFPSYVDSRGSGNADMLLYLNHSDSTARYIDYVVCPHWSLLSWFPPDSTAAIGVDDWPLYSAQAKPSLYWLPARTQYFKNQHLPGGEATLTRTDLISAPLMDGALASFVNSAFPFANQTSWWGISRFKVQNRLPAAPTLDSSSSSRWSFTNATAAFGATIVLTPSATTITAKYSGSSFSQDPRLLLQLMDSISVNWSGSTVLGCVVSMVGIDGKTHTLATAPGTYAWRQGPEQTKYAGTWGENFGVGFDSSDQGTDTITADGISASEMASAETAYALELLQAGTFQGIQFVFTLSGTGSTVTLNYPTITTRQDAPLVLAENGQVSAGLWQDGPGVRFGQWTFWDPIGNAWVGPTPTVIELGYGWSVLDWLATRRLTLDGIAPDSGIDTEIATLYDSTEGQTRALVANGTMAFVALVRYDLTHAKLTGFLVNTEAEVPPMAMFPFPARDAWYQPGTGWDQMAYSHTQEPRYIIRAGGSAADVFKPDGTQWTALGGPLLDGWTIHRHSHVVDNTEGPNFPVKALGTQYATVSPWHGYLCAIAIHGYGCGYDVSNSLRHVRAWVAGSGRVILGFAGNVLPQIWSEMDTGLSATWARPRFADHGPTWPVGLFYGDGTHCYWARTYDQGATWVDAIDMASGTIGDFEEGANGLRWFFKLVASGPNYDVWGKLMDSQLNVIRGWTITNVTGVDNEPIACREAPGQDGSWRIGLFYSIGGVPTVKFAPDGLTFT